LRAELGIAEDVPIHRIDLSGWADRIRVIPRVTRAREGDVVQIVLLDHRVHLLVWEREALSAQQWAFLTDSGQDAFPPLVMEGSKIVLSMRGAPTGRYPFRIEGNGPGVPAELTIIE